MTPKAEFFKMQVLHPRSLVSPAAIIVFRCHDKSINNDRLRVGADVSRTYQAPLFQPFEINTLVEARIAVSYALELGWPHLCLVTSGYHRDRAILSTIKEVSCTPIYLSTYCIYDGTKDTPENFEIEEAKIAEYQAKGDIATYEEGIAWLKASRW